MDILESLHEFVVFALQFVELEGLHVAEVSVLAFQQLVDLDCALPGLLVLSTAVVDAHDVLAVRLEVSAHVEYSADSSICQSASFHYITSAVPEIYHALTFLEVRSPCSSVISSIFLHLTRSLLVDLLEGVRIEVVHDDLGAVLLQLAERIGA